MRSLLWSMLLLGIAFTQARAGDLKTERLEQWPQWRGPDADGVASHAKPPLHWDEQTNLRWKVEVPGLGSSTPIVWDGQVFLLTAIKTDRTGPPRTAGADNGNREQTESRQRPNARSQSRERVRSGNAESNRRQRGNRPGRLRRRGGRSRGGSAAPTNVYQFAVLSYNRQTGDLNWKSVANETVPHEGFREGDNSFASGSPVTDGSHLYASFGSYGVYCFDLEGKLVWERDLGDMRTRNGFGEGASPALFRGRLVVPWDQEAQSKLFVLDAQTGETLWEVDRDEPTAWATPLVVERGGHAQVITNATNRVRSYDLETGDLLWECGGQTTNAIPSPVVRGDNVICMTGFRGNALYSIPLSSQGDLTDSDRLAWFYNGQTSYRPSTPYVPSPLLYGDTLYFTKSNNAILSCLNAETGEVLFDNQRLPGLGTIYASPVGADGRIYLVDRDGKTLVFKHGPEFEVLATNSLDDSIDASPAVVGNEIFLRGKKFLYAIAEE